MSTITARSLAALETFPAHPQSRDRLRRALAAGLGDEVVRAFEGDLALALRLLRLANRGSSRRSTASVVAAVELVGRPRLAALAEAVPVSDPLVASDEWGRSAELHRRHARAVHAATDRLSDVLDDRDRDELLAAALVHDVGELALAQTDAEYLVRFDAVTPEERVCAERRELGTDHTEIGEEIGQAWGFPDRLVEAIACHHSSGDGCASLVRLADLLAHYGDGQLVDLEQLVALSEGLGIDRGTLGVLLYELPEPLPAKRRVAEACPLSDRELDVLRLLADGKVYKQIAHDLDLSASTVRTHLHRIYTRTGAADRAQVVLLAAERGWI